MNGSRQVKSTEFVLDNQGPVSRQNLIRSPRCGSGAVSVILLAGWAPYDHFARQGEEKEEAKELRRKKVMARQDEGSFVPPSTLGVSRLRTRADETAIRPKGIRGFLRSRMESANSPSVRVQLVRL